MRSAIGVHRHRCCSAGCWQCRSVNGVEVEQVGNRHTRDVKHINLDWQAPL